MDYTVGLSQRCTLHGILAVVPALCWFSQCPLCLNKSFLAQEHPPGLTLEIRPEVKRWQKRKICAVLSLSSCLLPSDLPPLLILVPLVPVQNLWFWDASIYFPQFCALSSLLSAQSLVSSASLVVALSTRKGIRKPLVPVITCNFCTSVRI